MRLCGHCITHSYALSHRPTTGLPSLEYTALCCTCFEIPETLLADFSLLRLGLPLSPKPSLVLQTECLCLTPNLHIKALIPSVMVEGSGAFWVKMVQPS